VGDAKVLKDLVGEEDASIEFSVMIMGGSASVKKEEQADEVPVAQGISGKEVLSTEEFWEDLRGFLTQRLKHQGEGEKTLDVFRRAWESVNADP